MKKWILISITAVLAAVFVSGMLIPAWSADVKLMTKDELKKDLKDTNTHILDVRSGRDWNSSEFKIQGAKRADPSAFSKWASTYPKAGTLVLYCA